MFDEQHAANRRYIEADLITGAVELSALQHHGIPAVRVKNFPEPPAEILMRVVQSLTADDLTPLSARVWARLGAIWRRRQEVTWDGLEVGADGQVRQHLVWVRSSGLHLPLYCPISADRLIRLSAARDRHGAALLAAAEALEEAQQVVRAI